MNDSQKSLILCKKKKKERFFVTEDYHWSVDDWLRREASLPTPKLALHRDSIRGSFLGEEEGGVVPGRMWTRLKYLQLQEQRVETVNLKFPPAEKAKSSALLREKL